MQKLHLVGFTTDHRSLILSARRGARSGSFEIEVDVELLGAVQGALAEQEPMPEASPAPVEAARPTSALSVRDVQARLRAGRTVAEVAVEAGVDEEWVARFAVPVMAELGRVVAEARGATFDRPRRGPSALPLAASAYRNLVDRGLTASLEELDRGWSVRQVADGRWLVRLDYRLRGRALHGAWEYDARTRELHAADRSSAALGHVEEAAPVGGPPPVRPGRRAPTGAARPVPAPSTSERAATRRVADARREAEERLAAAVRSGAARAVAASRRVAEAHATRTPTRAPRRPPPVVAPGHEAEWSPSALAARRATATDPDVPAAVSAPARGDGPAPDIAQERSHPPAWTPPLASVDAPAVPSEDVAVPAIADGDTAGEGDTVSEDWLERLTNRWADAEPEPRPATTTPALPEPEPELEPEAHAPSPPPPVLGEGWSPADLVAPVVPEPVPTSSPIVDELRRLAEGRADAAPGRPRRRRAPLTVEQIDHHETVPAPQPATAARPDDDGSSGRDRLGDVLDALRAGAPGAADDDPPPWRPRRGRLRAPDVAPAPPPSVERSRRSPLVAPASPALPVGDVAPSRPPAWPAREEDPLEARPRRRLRRRDNGATPDVGPLDDEHDDDLEPVWTLAEDGEGAGDGPAPAWSDDERYHRARYDGDHEGARPRFRDDLVTRAAADPSGPATNGAAPALRRRRQLRAGG